MQNVKGTNFVGYRKIVSHSFDRKSRTMSSTANVAIRASSIVYAFDMISVSGPLKRQFLGLQLLLNASIRVEKLSVLTISLPHFSGLILLTSSTPIPPTRIFHRGHQNIGQMELENFFPVQQRSYVEVKPMIDFGSVFHLKVFATF